MEQENQRVRLTKRLLQEALVELLRKKSIRAVTVTELCQAAGINRSTFYAHYQTPRDVLMDMERDFSERSMRSFTVNRENATLQEHLTHVCRFVKENEELQRLILSNNTAEDLDAVFLDEGFAIWDISVYFPEWKRRDPDSRRLATVLVNYGIFCVIRAWIMEDIPKSPEEVAELMMELLYHGK